MYRLLISGLFFYFEYFFLTTTVRHLEITFEVTDVKFLSLSTLDTFQSETLRTIIVYSVFDIHRSSHFPLTLFLISAQDSKFARFYLEESW